MLNCVRSAIGPAMTPPPAPPQLPPCPRDETRGSTGVIEKNEYDPAELARSGRKWNPLGDLVSVRYQGKVILFARSLAGAPGSNYVNALYYNIRAGSSDATAASVGTGPFTGWFKIDLTAAANSEFIGSYQAGATLVTGYQLPVELRVMGMSLISVDPATAVTLPQGSPPGASATALSPADAPFCAVADDDYICVFRASVAGSLYLNRFVLVEVPGPNIQSANAAAAPQTTFVLQPAFELRYVGTGLRDTPSGPADSLSHRDKNGAPFIEPTMELPETLRGSVQSDAIRSCAVAECRRGLRMVVRRVGPPDREPWRLDPANQSVGARD